MRHAQAVSRILHLVTPEYFHRLCYLIARARLLVADRCLELYPGDISSASPIPTGHIPRPTLSPAFQSFECIMADELQTSIIYTLQHLHANHVDQLPLGLMMVSTRHSGLYTFPISRCSNLCDPFPGSLIMQGTQKQTHERPYHASKGPTDLAIISRPRYRTSK
ncbi:hypothetical protein BO85DRAFT_461238 [Aspergillus piperis CBS 112811]|uniref:Uncharacterized protein n=1 Tax=Aspergillus piperis CBS 112811 TaxID=1448313 RepID=A0A8G1VJH0_9EURO|nr:hypothetical protein BO85DRAFT_461238 [Aspergillus piperis CBS 112811]RAH55609.1 hypothetical protein BO85DRAFT_461238 [Aspergillus piperis CBS 112811]